MDIVATSASISASLVVAIGLLSGKKRIGRKCRQLELSKLIRANVMAEKLMILSMGAALLVPLLLCQLIPKLAGVLAQKMMVSFIIFLTAILTALFWTFRRITRCAKAELDKRGFKDTGANV